MKAYLKFALTYLAGVQASEGGPMLSTVRNMLYDRKVGTVVMLSGFMENGQVITYTAH